MKAILECNLPDERDEHLLAFNGGKYWAALWEFHQKLRSIEKYGITATTAKAMLEEVQGIWDEATWNIDWDEIS